MDVEDIPNIDDDYINSRKVSMVSPEGEIIGEAVIDENGMVQMLQQTDIEGVRHLNDNRTYIR